MIYATVLTVCVVIGGAQTCDNYVIDMAYTAQDCISLTQTHQSEARAAWEGSDAALQQYFDNYAIDLPLANVDDMGTSCHAVKQ